MEELGLAQSVMQQTQPMRDVDQIVQMLRQGVKPEELTLMGIPQELVNAALEIISKQVTSVNPQQEGLSGMVLR